MPDGSPLLLLLPAVVVEGDPVEGGQATPGPHRVQRHHRVEVCGGVEGGQEQGRGEGAGSRVPHGPLQGGQAIHALPRLQAGARVGARHRHRRARHHPPGREVVVDGGHGGDGQRKGTHRTVEAVQLHRVGDAVRQLVPPPPGQSSLEATGLRDARMALGPTVYTDTTVSNALSAVVTTRLPVHAAVHAYHTEA